jgi:hypothetical protein
MTNVPVFYMAQQQKIVTAVYCELEGFLGGEE